jgi:hypothetical protein
VKPKLPDWFKINRKYVCGVCYVADNGFASEKQDSKFSSSILISCLLIPLMQVLQLPIKDAHQALSSYLLLEEQDVSTVAECIFIDTPEREVATPDADDFEFEPIGNGSTQLSVQISVTEVGEDVHSPNWDRLLAKVINIAKEITYTRLAQAWSSQDVGVLLLRMLQHLESFEPSSSCSMLVVKIVLLLRDRMLDTPADAAALLSPLLVFLRPNAHAWSRAAGPSAAALALIASFAATRPVDWGAAEGVHDGGAAAVRHARDVWGGGGRAACDAVAARAELWEAGGAGDGDEDGEAEAGHVAQSLLVGGAGWAGEALLAAGFVRSLSLRVLAQAAAVSGPTRRECGR